jgi:hypothetical protein
VRAARARAIAKADAANADAAQSGVRVSPFTNRRKPRNPVVGR